MTNYNKLAQQLIYIRKANGYTQQQLSAAIGINRSTYASYETGRNMPNVYILDSIAQVFGITVDDIIHISDEELEK